MKESSSSSADSAQPIEDPRTESEESGESKYEKCGLKVTARAPIKQAAFIIYRRQSGDACSTGHSSLDLLYIFACRMLAPPVRTIQLERTLGHATRQALLLNCGPFSKFCATFSGSSIFSSEINFRKAKAFVKIIDSSISTHHETNYDSNEVRGPPRSGWRF